MNISIPGKVSDLLMKKLEKSKAKKSSLATATILIILKKVEKVRYKFGTKSGRGKVFQSKPVFISVNLVFSLMKRNLYA